jgi:predicted N-acyltransferase
MLLLQETASLTAWPDEEKFFRPVWELLDDKVYGKALEIDTSIGRRIETGFEWLPVSSEARLTQELRPIHEFQPLTDPRWDEFLQRHPCSSIFHTVEWLETLHRTYGYEPVAFTTSRPGTDLLNAAVFCRVESWLTGRRLVSLPFSDHCDLLADTVTDLTAIVSVLREQLHRDNLLYIEARPLRTPDQAALEPNSTFSYCFHQIDLRPDLETLLRNCHKNSTQRKISRAEREGLTYEEGRSETLLDSFYRLYLLTRRRQRVLPQPKRWFQNLIDFLGEALKIRVAFKNGQPIASILTLRYKDTLVYKYGCSDANFQRLGGVHLLFWRSIQEAKRDGLRVFDLGRSEFQNSGLITFKDRWGARRSVLTYFRLLDSLQSKGAFVPAGSDWKERAAKKAFPRLPDRVVRAAGDLICRHVG